MGDISAEIPKEVCTPNSLKAPFPEKFVRLSLQKFKVPESSWEPIVQGLDEKGKNVVKIVESKAAKMTPNPLENPKQGLVIVKLFKETLLEVSEETFKQNGVTDATQIQNILDDIQEQKRQQFANCIRQDKLPMPNALKDNVQ
ncbi:MAG: hypothetical protein ACXWM7_07975 [Parachlamydiaceae bacterium]